MWKRLDENNPQKSFVYVICRLLYYFGLGDCWYEGTDRSKSYNRKVLYKIWCIISNGFLISVMFTEIAANFKPDLSTKERNDVVQFSWAHPTVYLKILFFSLQRYRIRDLLKILLEDTRSVYTCRDIEVAALRTTLKYSGAVCFLALFTLFLASIDNFVMHLREGIPMRTEVTYWTTLHDHGVWPDIFRIATQFHWWYLVVMMITIDSLSFSCLAILCYKFKLLQKIFEEMNLKVANVNGNLKVEVEEQMTKDFISAIKLHEDTLWCARNIQRALGNTYSVQVIQSITLLIMCLVKLVADDRSIVYLSASIAYITCIFIITGSYMLAGGNITYEASVVSTSIFHCGWEMFSRRAKLRPLLTLAIQRSQIPVVMTAFGILDLSYSNYILVIRTSYSFFAVMYNKANK